MEDFYPEAMRVFEHDGVQTCMPQNVSSLVLYYNRDLFQEAGVPFPSDGWTWNDMVEKAADRTRGGATNETNARNAGARVPMPAARTACTAMATPT